MASGCITLRKYCEAVSTRAELARELFTVPARLCTQTRGENARVSCVHFFILLGLRYMLPSLLKWNHVPRCRVLNLSLPPSFSMMAIVHLYGGVWSCSLDKTSSQASVLVAFIWWENRGDCSVCTEALRLLGGVTPAHCPSSNLSLHAADYWEGGWLSFHSHP